MDQNEPLVNMMDGIQVLLIETASQVLECWYETCISLKDKRIPEVSYTMLYI